MSFSRHAAFLTVLSLCLPAASCMQARTAARPQVDSAALMQAVRAYGQNIHPAMAEVAPQHAQEPRSPGNSARDNEGEYEREIAGDLAKKNFNELDSKAHEARAEKLRFSGGIWKLDDFYTALSTPIIGQQATDEDWKLHIATLKEWELAKPESVTARVALAETYIEYADHARGQGYADSVSDTGWKLHTERNALAACTLLEAARLKEKCPYWYEVMPHVALGQGWDKSSARELFEQAVAFEPGYYHFYREYTYYLLPKWYGGPGEAEEFAAEVSRRVSGPEGKFIYFEVASLITCQCDSSDSHLEKLSWPAIKEGYAALGQLYGLSPLKTNRFAHMAYEAGDQNAAKEAFAMIGDDWDHQVWRSSANIETAKVWAAN
jgi:Domain of unknown function (DUF4034)